MESTHSLLIAVGAVAAVWFVTSRLRGRGAAPREIESSARSARGRVGAAYYLRFGPELGASMQDAVRSLSRSGELAPGDVREAALALARAAGAATHGWSGPAADRGAGATVRVTGGEHDGVIVALHVRGTGVASASAAPSDGAAIAAALRELSSVPASEIHSAEFMLATLADDLAAPTLVALRAATLPGQRACRFCGRATPAYETQCAHCGARATE